MTPDEIKKSYDQIASWWREHHAGSAYGLSQLERALQIAPGSGDFLDVGCGSEGRFLRVVNERGYRSEGLDISSAMVNIARKHFPENLFYCADICEWKFPKAYDLIAAWDSTFHLPLPQQAPVLGKLCNGLKSGGIVLFTCGGGDEPGEITGTFAGQNFSYSTLGVRAFVDLLHSFSCTVMHLEYDQLPESHVTIIAKKI